jgi:hypothetical protein
VEARRTGKNSSAMCLSTQVTGARKGVVLVVVVVSSFPPTFPDDGTGTSNGNGNGTCTGNNNGNNNGNGSGTGNGEGGQQVSHLSSRSESSRKGIAG